MGEKLKKRTKENYIEIITAIFLGLTALTMAWATWIGALHSGNQATNYTTSNNISSEGNSMFNEASQSLMQDMMTWNDIKQARLDYVFAEKKNDKNAMEKAAWIEEEIIADNCSENFADAINWADNQEENVSPFDKEGYIDSYYEAANDKLQEADALLEQGKQDNAHGDAYGLVTVIFSIVLFLLGIVSIFKHIPNRLAILGVSIVGFLVATIYMFTIPLPTGFSIFNYFG